MTIKSVAITEDEIPIYEQEENLAKLYERREEEYNDLVKRLSEATIFFANISSLYDDPKDRLLLDICEFLLREAQFRKLI